jgi:hypothetical protein
VVAIPDDEPWKNLSECLHCFVLVDYFRGSRPLSGAANVQQMHTRARAIMLWLNFHRQQLDAPTISLTRVKKYLHFHVTSFSLVFLYRNRSPRRKVHGENRSA